MSNMLTQPPVYMVKRLCSRNRFLVVVVLLACFTPVYPASINAIKWAKSDTSVQFFITPSQRVGYLTENLLAENGYFVLELLGITQNYGTKWIEVKEPYLSRVLVQSDGDRLKFFFYPPVMTNMSIDYDRTKKDTLVVTITPFLKNPEGCKVIIIDPGHGGKSRGARSAYKINGKYVWEKDVVLQMSYKLKRLIDQSPGYVARLTRTDDSYVGLSERVELSRKLGGDLFVSIHCNAVRGFRATNARGIEFYCWSHRGTDSETGKFLESLENEEMLDISQTDSNGQLKKVLTNLLKEELQVQKQESLNLCSMLNASFKKDSYFLKYNRGIKEARFKVLANYEMPATLIEVGFISNPYEAKLLIDSDFQWRACRAIFAGIQGYFSSKRLTVTAE